MMDVKNILEKLKPKNFMSVQNKKNQKIKPLINNDSKN